MIITIALQGLLVLVNAGLAFLSGWAFANPDHPYVDADDDERRTFAGLFLLFGCNAVVISWLFVR